MMPTLVVVELNSRLAEGVVLVGSRGDTMSKSMPPTAAEWRMEFMHTVRGEMKHWKWSGHMPLVENGFYTLQVLCRLSPWLH
jgi:hypothetical protein